MRIAGAVRRLSGNGFEAKTGRELKSAAGPAPNRIYRKTGSYKALTVLPIFIGLAISLTAIAQRAHLPSTTHLSATAAPGEGKTTFTIKVEGGDRGVPTGAVTLSRGQSSIGSVLLDEHGAATYTADAATASRITAVYEGDAGFGPSASLAVDAPAASGFPTYTLSANPTTLSVKRGAYVTTVVTVNPANGFADPVTLSCSALPVNTTCSFIPTRVVPNGTAPATTSVSSVLYIQTFVPSGSGSGALRMPVSPNTPAYAVVVPGLAALAGLGLLRKRAFGAARLLGVMALLLAGGLGLSACSARYSYFHHPPLGNPGTPIGTSTFLVNGASASAGTSVIPTPVQIVLTVTQ